MMGQLIFSRTLYSDNRILCMEVGADYINIENGRNNIFIEKKNTRAFAKKRKRRRRNNKLLAEGTFAHAIIPHTYQHEDERAHK